MTLEHSDLPINLNHLLAPLFEAHGIATNTNGEWIEFPGHTYRAAANIVRRIPNAGGLSVQLDVCIRLRPAQNLVESCAGLGADLDAAISDAIRAFAAGSFHVILVALFGRSNEHAETVEWVIKGEERRVNIGSAVARGALPDGFNEAVYKPFTKLIQESTLLPGVHWVRLYYAQGAGKVYSCELLLDNSDWQPLLSSITQLSWPKTEPFYSVRLFIMIDGGVGVGEAVEMF